MPQYPPPSPPPPPPSSWKVDGGAQVIDLETAVKDGILGGGNAVGAPGLTTAEKLDLKKMVEEIERSLNLEDVPSVFICPISLQPMVEPVTLCTGQTYERSNILRWLSMGHLTCPTTMQELWDDCLTPNRTLHHLIYAWFSQRYLLLRKRSHDAHGSALDLLDSLRRGAKGQARLLALRDLHRLLASSSSARKALSSETSTSFLCSLLGPFTSHAVGSEVVAILFHLLPLDPDAKSSLLQPARLSLLVDILNEGTADTRLSCVRLLESLLDSPSFRPDMVSSMSLLVALLRLVKDRRHPTGVSAAGLRLLRLICAHRQVRAPVVSAGAVPQIVEMLPGLPPECAEYALCVLDALSSIPEGRGALKRCSHAIPSLVRLLMRVSETCTHCALNVLTELCRLSPEECAPTAVESGLAARLLLVLQSGCNQQLKQRAAELLKLCSLNYSTTNFISKCKLTRTIQ